MSDVPIDPIGAARFGITDVQEAWLSAPMSDAARMLSEIRERHAADDLGDESLTQAERDRLWLLDMVDHLRTKHAETHATSMRWAEQFTRAEAHLKRLTASAGRSVEPLAEKAARLEAEAARLPEEDMVEPGDEVPGLAELRALVERLALDQAGTTKAVTKLLATVEDRLGITDEEPPADGILPSVRELRRMHEEEKASTPEAPTRYRDRDGDLWEETSPGYLLLAVRRLPHVRMSRPYAVVADEFGPLTPVTT